VTLRQRAVPLVALLTACGSSPPAAEDTTGGVTELVAPAAGKPRILAFTRTQGFRHDSIPAAVQCLTQLAEQRGFGLSSTEDPTQFTEATLAGYAAVVFLSTTGDILNAEQQSAFERYIAAGHGYVGVHAAADCEYDWPYYGGLVGAYFAGHSLVVSANVEPEPLANAAISGVPAAWAHVDEWYGFRNNPRSSVNVLLTVDEATYDPGQGRMGADHPVAWFHSYQGGRAFYTALGHTAETYNDPVFSGHLRAGIEWAAGLAP
jgi:type 1 glutamine amidotransferase